MHAGSCGREKEALEKVKQELLRKVERVKQESDCLKQKNTQLVEGMLLLRAKLHGAFEVVDSMEVLQDEVLLFFTKSSS